MGRHAGSASAGLAVLLLSVTPAGAATAVPPGAVLPDSRDSQAHCRTSVQGSQAVARCHNPYPRTDRVRLHIECARWWDIDTDSAPVAAEPAMTVRIEGRCWKEIRAVWVSHER
ncbi:hypothetical protein DY218_29625 [Streptomyces triticagri]|uniref:Secreted protein n=1 Tax=Streptomyces triticagri TaxID=2293568 RepID=A0A372LWS8_9ACTN|nr:hypothetical protein DY218_29625 [Streptomyces triticagri]